MKEINQEVCDNMIEELDISLTQLQGKITAINHNINMFRDDIEAVSVVLKANTKISAKIGVCDAAFNDWG
jgi:hypothetical protein